MPIPQNGLHGKVHDARKTKLFGKRQETVEVSRDVSITMPKVGEYLTQPTYGNATYDERDAIEEGALVVELCIVDVVFKIVLHVQHVILADGAVGTLGLCDIAPVEVFGQGVYLLGTVGSIVHEVVIVAVAEDEHDVRD